MSDEFKLRYKEDDIETLLPSVKPRVAAVIRDMKWMGFQPVLKDTRRTAAEAAANAANKTGIKLSMHMFDCAADVICNQHGWSCAEFGCKFYVRLGQCVTARGMYWGGSFGDMPHMQALPFTTKVQDKMRALGTGAANALKRDALARRYLKTSTPLV